MAKDFEGEVLQRLARMEAKQDETAKKLTETYDYRNSEIAPRLPVIDKLDKDFEKHTDGHERWRIGAGLAIIGAYLKGMF